MIPCLTLRLNALPIAGLRRSPSIRITRLSVSASDAASEIAEVVLPSPGPGARDQDRRRPVRLPRIRPETARRVL